MISESILSKIEDQSVEAKNHPGIKIGNEKYLGIKEDYMSQAEKEEKVIIEGIKSREKNKKSGCCKG